MATVRRILFGDTADWFEQLRDAFYTAVVGALMTFIVGLASHYAVGTGEPSELAGIVGLAAFAARLRK